MSNEEDTIVAQIDAPPIESPNPIADFLNSVEKEDYVSAEKEFNDLVGDRLQDTLDQAKISIAQSIYNVSDEELEDIVSEVE
tara:strand:+ start:1382 stop:1627 length:246 start_codon:yes stop_codon:yes gene_type:complete